MNLKDYIRNIPNFPIDGVQFKDISTILSDAECMKFAIDEMIKKIEEKDFDLIVGAESRGFIVGTPIAYKLNKGFIPIRKAGRLPYKTISKEYNLEYGTNKIEMHIDAIKKGQGVIIVDDLLATGGTCKAMTELIEEAGGIVKGIVFLIELEDLKGKDLLVNYEVDSIIKY